MQLAAYHGAPTVVGWPADPETAQFAFGTWKHQSKLQSCPEETATAPCHVCYGALVDAGFLMLLVIFSFGSGVQRPGLAC